MRTTEFMIHKIIFFYLAIRGNVRPAFAMKVTSVTAEALRHPRTYVGANCGPTNFTLATTATNIQNCHSS